MRYLILLVALAFLEINLANGQCATVTTLCINEFRLSLLRSINRFRADHGAHPLRMDDSINFEAQRWACSLAPNGVLSPSRVSYAYGESSSADFSTMPFPQTLFFCNKHGSDVAARWYSQSRNFDFNTGRCNVGAKCDDFTQMVWRGSDRVGFGLGFSHGPLPSLGNRYFFVVTAQYLNKGNNQFSMLSNVLRFGSPTPPPTPATTTRSNFFGWGSIFNSNQFQAQSTTTTTTTTTTTKNQFEISSACSQAFYTRLFELINQRRDSHRSPPVSQHTDPTFLTRTLEFARQLVSSGSQTAKNPNYAAKASIQYSEAYISPRELNEAYCRSLAESAVSKWYRLNGYMDYKTGRSWCPMNQDLSDFTALVWKSATRFSCQFAAGKEGFASRYAVACDIDPATGVNDQALVLENVGRPGPAVSPQGLLTVSQACFDAFHNASLSQANIYRIRHQVPASTVITNATLKQVPVDYAQKLATEKSTSHNPDLNRLAMGENLYFAFQPGLPNLNDVNVCAQHGRAAVDAWYSEIKSYNFDNGSSLDGGVIGHFTQLVWKTSTELACGLAASGDTDSRRMYWIVVVCNYRARGNFAGAYTSNVLRALP